MQSNSQLNNNDFYSTKELAMRLDVSARWLEENRRSSSPIPFYRFGRHIRYYKKEVQKWIGRSDLDVNYFSARSLARRLNLTKIWIETNRYSKNPIPHRKFGRLIRYQVNEVEAWLRKMNNSV